MTEREKDKMGEGQNGKKATSKKTSKKKKRKKTRKNEEYITQNDKMTKGKKAKIKKWQKDR